MKYAAIHRVAKSRTRLSNWTELNWMCKSTESLCCTMVNVCMVNRFCCVQLFATLWITARQFFSPWDSPGKNTGVGCHALLQGTFPTQGLNPGLPHCRQILYQLSYQGSLNQLYMSIYPLFFILFSNVMSLFFTIWATRGPYIGHYRIEFPVLYIGPY